jgi:hypothetical protein
MLRILYLSTEEQRSLAQASRHLTSSASVPWNGRDLLKLHGTLPDGHFFEPRGNRLIAFVAHLRLRHADSHYLTRYKGQPNVLQVNKASSIDCCELLQQQRMRRHYEWTERLSWTLRCRTEIDEDVIGVAVECGIWIVEAAQEVFTRQ